MTEEKNDMFSEDPQTPDDKKLWEYLNGTLSEADKLQFENQVPQDPFLMDAVEGLNAVEDKEGLHKTVSQMNHQLHRHLLPKKTRASEKGAKFGEWIYWSILIVLLLAITGFLMLRFMLK